WKSLANAQPGCGDNCSVLTSPRGGPGMNCPRCVAALRSDVLVQPEEVRRVVLALERPEPLVLGLAVGCPNSVRPLLPEKVHVNTPSGTRRHPPPQPPGPREARGRGGGLGPDGVDVPRRGRPPVLEGRSFRILSTDSAAQVEDDRVRLRCRPPPGPFGE